MQPDQPFRCVVCQQVKALDDVALRKAGTNRIVCVTCLAQAVPDERSHLYRRLED